MAHNISHAHAETHVLKMMRDPVIWRLNEERHVNHSGCPAGEDTKARLYVKRTEYGYVGYCHNCQGSFVLKSATATTTSIRKKLMRESDMHDTDSESSLPKVLSSCTQFSTSYQLKTDYTDAYVWLNKYLDDWDINFLCDKGILGRNTGGLIIRTYNYEESCGLVSTLPYIDNGIIRRTFDPSASGPKTLSFAKTGGAWYKDRSKPVTPDTILFIVEDVVSLYKVAITMNFYPVKNIIGLSLNGTGLSEEIERKLHLFKKDMTFSAGTNIEVVLMLDPDTAGKMATRKIKSRLELLFDKVRVPELEKQPKELDKASIIKAITNV